MTHCHCAVTGESGLNCVFAGWRVSEAVICHCQRSPASGLYTAESPGVMDIGAVVSSDAPAGPWYTDTPDCPAW